MVSQHVLQVVSQHALQVSRGGSPGLHLVGKLRGLARGSPDPHPGGFPRTTPMACLQAHTWGGLQAHTQGGLQAHTRAGVSQYALRLNPHGRLLPWTVRILLECILVKNRMEIIFVRAFQKNINTFKHANIKSLSYTMCFQVNLFRSR